MHRPRAERPPHTSRLGCRLAAALALGGLAACGGGGGAGPPDAGADGPGADVPGTPPLLDGAADTGRAPDAADAPDAGPRPDGSTGPGPLCGNGILETGEACDVYGGCAAGFACSDACTCQPITPPVPGTLSLIADALAAGRIDYPTSLLLRAQALVGDERLPPEYDGDFTLAEDTALSIELSRVWDGLTDLQQAALHPYVVRPTDPDSVYSAPPTSPAGAPADMPPPVQCPKNTDTGVSDWRFTESDHFVIWSCGGGDPAQDPYAAKRDVVAAMAEEVWDLETPGLGAPRGDDFPNGPAPRSRIDVYLLRTNECRFRVDHCVAVTAPDTLAAAAADSPCDIQGGGPYTSSGYMLLRLERVPDSGSPGQARADFAHEFFHLISFGRSLEGQGGGCKAMKKVAVGARGSWLTEASAVWAEWAYVPDDDAQFRTDHFTSFQYRNTEKISLLTVLGQTVDDEGRESDYDPSYQAFTYPVFMCHHFVGSAPILHQDIPSDSGEQTLDWKVTWDIRINRKR